MQYHGGEIKIGNGSGRERLNLDPPREMACDVESVCYFLCLDGGVDKSNQPLRRDCACRGTDAGFVHLSCLAEYTATKSKRWDGRQMKEFVEPWRVCPGCHQEYQNELAVAIAAEFVSFVRRQYPDDTQKQVDLFI